jgi:TolB-like protein/DNA-binding winged helix-turn-helix (wHTH) protein
VVVTVFEFGDFKLDCDRFELYRAGRSLKLERKPMELLILLAARNGHLVTRTEIAERLWDREVFVDTEHGINTAIRKIRQVLGDDSEQPRFLLTVTGKGYRFIGTIAEVSQPLTEVQTEAQAKAQAEDDNRLFPIVANASNDEANVIDSPQARAEIPPQVPAATPTPEKRAMPSHDFRLLLWLGAVGAVTALAFFVISLGATGWKSRFKDRLLGRTSTHAIKSLAVLPLDNLSGDPGQEYFADGMTDELITMLAKNSTLRIVSRTSVMQYKRAHRPLPEIARELGVDGILEGSISRSGDKVHMTVQLIQAPSDTHVWAESYDREKNDVASLPMETAQTIATQLHSAVLQPTPPRFVSPEAHDAYLRGRYIWFTGSNDEAGKYFKKATELQPDYALGWSGLSVYYGAGAIEGNLNPEDSLPWEEAAAVKAVELDDSLPEAHLALGAAIFLNRWDWVRADREIARAIELNPSFAEACHFRSKMFTALHRSQEAIAAQKKSTELDPFARPFAMGLAYFSVRQYDAAINDVRLKLESSPQDIGLHWILCEAYRRKGALKDAAQEWEKSMLLVGDKESAASIRRNFERGGYKAVLRWQLSSLQKKSAKQYVSPVDLALQYAQLGKREETLTLLEAGYRQRSPLLLWIQNDPAYDFLHSDERYRGLIREIGLPPAY